MESRKGGCTECFGGANSFGEGRMTVWGGLNCPKKSILPGNAIDIMLKPRRRHEVLIGGGGEGGTDSWAPEPSYPTPKF